MESEGGCRSDRRERGTSELRGKKGRYYRTMLREYLAATESGGGGTSGMQVVWNNCPNFSGKYGGASGELHL